MNVLLGKKILVLTAHPDDEAYASAGTLHLNRKMGGTNYLICATLGERGSSHLKRRITSAELKKIRKQELIRAAKFLGVSKLLILNFPDGKVDKHKKILLGKVADVAFKYRPDFIMSFGPDGISGHRDHIAVGEIARQVARGLKTKLAVFTLPPKFKRQAEKWLLARRRAPHYKKGIAFANPDLRVKIDPEIKKRALRFHASQMDDENVFSGFPKYAVRELLRYEYFRFLL